MKNGFDMAKVQRGARLRRSPFYAATQKHNPQGFTVYNHMLFPIRYGDLEEEYWKLINDVTVWDVSVERQVEITGIDAFDFANLLPPRDLTQCRVGQGKYVLITDENGGIINDPVLLRLGENHFWLALADSDVLLWAKGVALSAGLSVEIKEPDVSPLQIQGPKSKGVVEALFGPPALELDYYFFLETELDGIPVVLTRTGWSGEVGYEIYLRDGSRGDRLWEMVMDAGKPFGIAPTGPSDIRRVEAGILNYGADMTLENNPYEVGLGWLVNLEQSAEFVGKKALTAIQAQGVSKKLVGVAIDGPPIEFNMTRWPVLVGDQVVGQVTSALYSPRFEKNIGYAMVPLAYTDLGTGLTVKVEGIDPRPAAVVRKPFHDPTKELPKS